MAVKAMNDKPEGQNTRTFSFRWGIATDIGYVRERNEDAFVVEAQMGLFAVIDGMGGHRAGDVAAQMVAEGLPALICREFRTMKTRQPRSLSGWIGQCIAEQSRHVCFQGFNETGLGGMGATVALLLLVEGRAYAGNLGDSRVYRFRSGRLTQLSRDHSVIAELLEAGEIALEEVHNHCARGLLTQYVGMPEEPKPYVRSFPLKPGDRFLLCTDGLTDMMDEPEMKRILGACANAQQAAETLVQAANDEGGLDNTTVAVVDCSL